MNGTGNALVGAVIRTLKKLGFTQVVDVDEAAKIAGEDRLLREDIQIRDEDPILIVDVKGIVGCPEDAAATQSEKHALMRSEEFNGKVKPLTIINHQRNLPPLERVQEPFRAEIIGNAQQTKLGLMTSWDLFRIMRNCQVLKWPKEVIKPIFYRTGRIEPVPEHYSSVGVVVEVWQNAFGMVPISPISIGDRLAIETEILFEEVAVESLHVNDQPVLDAPAGSNCGVGCEEATIRFRKGMRVFLIAK